VSENQTREHASWNSSAVASPDMRAGNRPNMAVPFTAAVMAPIEAEEIVVETIDLSRSYDDFGLSLKKRKKVEALRAVNLRIARGEIFGLLGPNGAGKTTLVRILSTALAPSDGEARVLGLSTVRDFRQIRSRINFLTGGDRGLYTRLSALQNLAYFASLYGLSGVEAAARISKLLDLVGLSKIDAGRLVGTYSRGMRQRVHIAKALINDPEVLFFDEPTMGVDPVFAVHFRDLMRQLKAGGKTILLTTHYMLEAEELCDRVAIIVKGEIVRSGTMTQLRAGISGIEKRLRLTVAMLEGEKAADLAAAIDLPGIETETTNGAQCVLFLPAANMNGNLSAALAKIGSRTVLDVCVEEPTLERIYVDSVSGN
jgi:ABC-2 type transport system ATP-binding protein